eukprot:SAG31_NODE_11527_length_1021_cov_0.939262_1_plen_274_part_10
MMANYFKIDLQKLLTMFHSWSTTQPWRDHRQTFDALQLGTLCGLPPPDRTALAQTLAAPASAALEGALHVDGVVGSDDSNDGSVASPFRSVARALSAARAIRREYLQQTGRPSSAAGFDFSAEPPPPIVLAAGVHFLNSSLILTPADNGQLITAADGADAWLSGGKELKVNELQWQRASSEYGEDTRVLVASLAALGNGSSLKAVPGLFGLKPHTRYTRARFPNADVETAQWGYDSPLRDQYSIEAAKVKQWHRPAAGKPPSYTYVDFTDAGNI